MASDLPTIAEPGRASSEGGAAADRPDRPVVTPNPPSERQGSQPPSTAGGTPKAATGWRPLVDQEMTAPPGPEDSGAPTLPPDDVPPPEPAREPSQVDAGPQDPGQSQTTDEVM